MPHSQEGDHMSEKNLMETIMKNTSDIVHTEDVMIEAVRDIIKDEIKGHIKDKLDANPELKAEFKEAINSLFEAKAQEVIALVKVAKCTAKLGLESIPPHMRESLVKELVSIFEKEIGSLLEKGL